MRERLSDTVVNRLTLYHGILHDYLTKGIRVISSPRIAALLRIDDSQVRKDLSLLERIGKSNVGYSVSELKNAIEETLRFEQPKDAFIVGAGNLGFALAKYDDFTSYGLNILALFDNDSLKIDMSVNKKRVFHLTKLPNLVERLKVELAILTVPREQAQVVTDFLVQSRIKYIWNFTPTVLDVQSDIQVWNENLTGNFLRFTYRI